MSLTLPSNVRGPILDLELPPSEDAIDLILRNKTTGKSLTINLPENWGGVLLGFEGGDFDGFSLGAKGEGTLEVSEDQAAEGTKSAKVILEAEQERAELTLGGDGGGGFNPEELLEGEECSFGFSVFIPEGGMKYGEPGAHNVIMQLFPADAPTSIPMVNMNLWDYEGKKGLWVGAEDPSTETKYERFVGAVPEGQWVRIRVDLKVSEDQQGYQRVWIDGEKVLDEKGVSTVRPETSYGYLKCGLYRDPVDIEGESTLYIDRVTFTRSTDPGYGGLSLDWFRRTIKDGSGADRSALLDPEDAGLWEEREPLVAGANDVGVEARHFADIVAENPFDFAFGGDYVYFTNGSEIGRASANGTNPDVGWFDPPGASGTNIGIATDGTYLYWSNLGVGGNIGRAKLDGSEPDAEWLTTPTTPRGIATDATYLYWGDDQNIGRAKLDGSEPDAEWLTTPTKAIYLAADGTYLYWSDETLDAIGRAKLDGSEPDAEWFTAPTQLGGFAVDDTYLYWGELGAAKVGRAKLDGSEPDAEWRLLALQGGAIVTRGGSVYWANRTTKKIESDPNPYTAKATLRWERGYY